MSFIELFEGMNQNKQKGMLSKQHFEKLLSNGKKIQIGDTTLWLSPTKKWMINDKETKFTQVYQMYRAAYKTKSINEVSTERMVDLKLSNQKNIQKSKYGWKYTGKYVKDLVEYLVIRFKNDLDLYESKDNETDATILKTKDNKYSFIINDFNNTINFDFIKL
jgi:hypothetical protein